MAYLRTVSRFVQNLLNLTNEADVGGVVEWREDGRVEVLDLKLFIDRFIQTHFPNAKYTSFRRQVHTLLDNWLTDMN